MNLGKRAGTTEQNETLSFLQIALIIVIVIGGFAFLFVKWVSGAVVTEQCRATMIANTLRVPDMSVSGFLWGSGKDKERIPVVCPRPKDFEIKYSDVKSSTIEGMKYKIEKKFAEEEKACQHRSIGDIKDAVPFANDPGTYCVICKEGGMDHLIAQEFRKENELIDGYLSFKMNVKMAAPKVYYSEYLYGFSKDQDEDINLTAYIEKKANEEGISLTKEQLGNIDKMDTVIDPLKRYYIMHIIKKGDNLVSKAINEQQNEIITKGAITAGICGTSQVVTLVTGATGQWYITVFSGALTLGCYAMGANTVWSVFNPDKSDDQQRFVRFTTIVPTDQLDNIGCDHIYGLERAKDPKENK